MLLPEKKKFYRSLIMENITGADFNYAERVGKDFRAQNLGEH